MYSCENVFLLVIYKHINYINIFDNSYFEEIKIRYDVGAVRLSALENLVIWCCRIGMEVNRSYVELLCLYRLLSSLF